jgi:hypothetical protein
LAKIWHLVWRRAAFLAADRVSRLEISNFLSNSAAIPSKIPGFWTKNHSFLAQTGKSQQLHFLTKTFLKKRSDILSEIILLTFLELDRINPA